MRRAIVVPVALALMFSAVCLAASDAALLAELARRFGPPVLCVSRPSVAPRVDGRLDDDAWSKAQPVTLSHLVDGWDTPSQKTEARVLADEKAIYFGVECLEAHPEQMFAAGEKRDGDLWNGDTVEFFLDPGHREKRGEYYHIIVNPKGLLYDARGKDPKAWDAQIEAKVGTFESGWTVEVAVPMKDLGFAAPGEIPRIWATRDSH